MLLPAGLRVLGLRNRVEVDFADQLALGHFTKRRVDLVLVGRERLHQGLLAGNELLLPLRNQVHENRDRGDAFMGFLQKFGVHSALRKGFITLLRRKEFDIIHFRRRRRKGMIK